MPFTVPSYIVLQKKRGETPLEALTAWKRAHAELADIPATYAGRLDPMAEGKLLILLGDECKRQDAYHNLDKEYEVEVVFDIETDTGDVLGIPLHVGNDTHVSKDVLVRALPRLKGTHSVPYPPYSSKTLGGVPLFTHALAGTLDTIDIPKHDETIYKISLVHAVKLPQRGLAQTIADHLKVVPRSDDARKELGADFRQDAIRSAWDKLFTELPGRYFTVATLRVTCASGTYMRTVATRLAAELGTTGFALSIKRTRIGRYTKVGPVGVWTKQYS